MIKLNFRVFIFGIFIFIRKYPSSDCAIVRLRESIPCELNNRFEKKTGTFLCVLSIVIRSATCTLLQAYIHKKSGRAFAYPQARESKPYTHKQEIPPAYHGEHLSVSLCIMQFLDFSLAQKSAKRFFSYYVKTWSTYDHTNIANYKITKLLFLYFFCPKDFLSDNLLKPKSFKG